MSGTSWASSPAARAVMRANRRRDTRPELAVRRELHRLGLRYRVDMLLPLPGIRRRADVTFTRCRVAVFIDGCYWHGCPQHGTAPATNAEYWSAKIAGNVARDRETDRMVREAGWSAIRVWEHEEPVAAARAIAAVVQSPAAAEPVRSSRI